MNQQGKDFRGKGFKAFEGTNCLVKLSTEELKPLVLVRVSLKN